MQRPAGLAVFLLLFGCKDILLLARSQACYLVDRGNSTEVECNNISHISQLTSLDQDVETLQVNGCELESNESSLILNNLDNIKHLEIVNCVNASQVFDRFKPFSQLRSLTITRSVSGELDISCDALRSLENLDLSDNYIKIFTPPTCPESSPLKVLNLHGNDLSSLDWSSLKVFPSLTSLNLSSNPSLSEMVPATSQLASLSTLDLSSVGLETLCDSVLRALPNLTSLLLRDVRLTNLPPTLLSVSPDLLDTVTPHCSCELLGLLRSGLGLSCLLGEEEVVLSSETDLLDRLECSPAEILSGEEEKWVEEPGVELVMDCQVTGSPVPTIVWLTPRHELLTLRPETSEQCRVQEEQTLSPSSRDYTSWEGHFTVLSNGSLLIDQFGWRDRGQYQCYVDNLLANSSLTQEIKLDHQYRQVIYLWSLLYGLVTAVSFLALTLLGKLIHHLAWNYGCCYCWSCCHSSPPPKIKRLTAVVDSIEQYRIGQLEKLRENYALQSQRIRDNYSLQLERLRENYSHQSRAENTENVNRMRDYSNMQLTKLHENYIFQRQRLRKFSAQNYLKIRETGKYTQKTLNRVIENMPTLTEMTNCRGGPDWDEEEEDPVEMLMMPCREETQSIYFTPTETPVREVVSPDLGGKGGGKRKSHKRMVSNLSNFLPFWWGMGQTEIDTNSNTIGTTVAVVEIEKPSGQVGTEDVQLIISPEDVKLTVKTDSETDEVSTESQTMTSSSSEDPK